MITLHHSSINILMIMLNFDSYCRPIGQSWATLELVTIHPRRAPRRITCRGSSKGGTMTVFSELRMRPAPAATAGWDASTTARLVLAGAVIFTLLVGANLATPLYPLLQVQLGLSPLDVAAAFTTYVLALVAVLMLAGHWSDHIGRRAALTLAVAAGLAGGWLFAEAHTMAALCAARALQGAAVALATGASAAALRELIPARPEWASRFTLLASAGGVAAGPVIGGLLSLLPGATSAPYYIHSAVLAALLVPLYLLRARPAIQLPAGPRPLQLLAPRRPCVTREARGAFWLASGVGFLSFAVFGFCLSLAPSYFARILAVEARPLIGLLACLTLAASALTQLVTVRSRFVVPAGLAVLGASILLLGAAGAWNNAVLLVAASLAAGVGQGLAFRTVFNAVAARVEPARQAQTISSLYVVTYLGSAVPVLGLGWAAGVFGLEQSVAGFVVLCSTAAFILAALTLRQAVRTKA
jgi:MFS family permease